MFSHSCRRPQRPRGPPAARSPPPPARRTPHAAAVRRAPPSTHRPRQEQQRVLGVQDISAPALPLPLLVHFPVLPLSCATVTCAVVEGAGDETRADASRRGPISLCLSRVHARVRALYFSLVYARASFGLSPLLLPFVSCTSASPSSRRPLALALALRPPSRSGIDQVGTGDKGNDQVS